MSEESNDRKRTRGAPKGNQNARKHNFYASPFDADPQRNFALASKLDGIDDEITLLRVHIKHLVDQHSQNPEAITRAVACLGQLQRLKNKTGNNDHKRIRAAIASLVEDLGIPPGLVGDSFRKRRPD